MVHSLTIPESRATGATHPEQAGDTWIKDSPVRAEGLNVVSLSVMSRRLWAPLVAVVLGVGLFTPAADAGAREPKPMRPDARAVENNPEFQWRPVAGATLYRLEVAFDHKFTDIAHTIDTPATRFIDTTAWPAASYWWRVKVIAPFDGSYSNVRSFTRRWMGPDASGHRHIARPDAVRVEDFATDPGIQVPANALKISWDPVPEASHYEVQFDGNASKTCTTPHSVLTPYLSGSLGSEKGGSACNPELAAGVHWIRVRAVDETVGDGKGKIYSLWSDEARTVDSAVPEPVVFTLGPNLSGPDSMEPAVLTSPRNGTVFLDVPTFEWEPVSWATEYELVLARDQDFTNVLGTFRTKNTRLVPLQRLPENTAIRSYYWYVVPCVESGDSTPCLNENRVVNREGKFRSFKKQSVLVKLSSIERRGTPWVEFTWEPYSQTMARFAHKTGTAGASMGGIKWYEFQIKARGASWDTARTVITDLPSVLPTELQFGGRFEWRVRPVDESGSARPWSDTRSLRTPLAVPENPPGLKARRTSGNRVRLTWRAPKATEFPVTSYSVYYSNQGKRWKPLTQVSRPRAAFKVGKTQRYWFMVTASNYAGEGPPSRVFVPR